MRKEPHSYLKHYPSDVPREINPNSYKSLVELFEASVVKYGSLTAFDSMGTSITYSETDRLSKNFASYLQNELKLKPGSRIAIQLPNLLQYPIVLFGALRAGLIIVNTNPLYTPREMKHQLVDSGAETIIILANFAHNLEKILSETPVKHIIVTQIGDCLGGAKKLLVNGVVKHIKKSVPKYNLSSAMSLGYVLKKGGKKSFRHVDINCDDIAFLQYTGGTTGLSKGAVLTHTNILANIEQLSCWFNGKLNYGGEIVITALPLYHILALTINLFTMFKIGARNVLILNPRDMKGFISELKKYPFSIITGVNTLYNGLLNHPGFEDVDFSHIKVSCAGGMAVQNSVAKRWKKKTGAPITEGYGLTETSPVLTANIPVAGKERIGTIGIPLPSTQIIIANDKGKEVPAGVVGEIYAKGPQVMREYWRQPWETESVFNGGWFKTGDMGIMDKEGFISIVDRKKEMINVSGFNVYPNEIEDVVAGHSKVLEVGAVGVPDKKSTEAVKIVVVRKDQSLTKEDLRIYCKENLTAYKVPKYIEFREGELPKTNVGKILRRVLK